MYDLARFSLKDMTECGIALRGLGAAAGNLDDAADQIVRYLYERLCEHGKPACVLVRLFKTQPFGELAPDLQRFAAGMLGCPPAIPTTPCFTLLATAGAEPAWNDRRQSQRFKAIPIADRQFAAQFPMFSQLLTQFGVEIDSMLEARTELLLDKQETTYNIFHVPEAAGSPYVPGQANFVIPYGVRSVLGFGGLLPSGSLFALILFARVSIPRETAELFRTLALSVKLALLPFDGGVPSSGRKADGGEGQPVDVGTKSLNWLKARAATQEQLLLAHEQAVITQAGHLAQAASTISAQADALRSIEAGTARTAGDDFFHSLVAHLAQALKVRCTLIGELAGPNKDRIRTLAVWAGNVFAPNVDYLLAGTPCAAVIQGQSLCFDRDVRRRFPDFPLFAELQAESYCGTPILDKDGRTLGLLAVIHDHSLEGEDNIRQLLTIFAARAGTELTRQRAEEALRQSEERYRSLVEVSPDGIFVNCDGKIAYINPAGLSLFGASEPGQIIGRSPLELVHADFQEKVRDSIRRLLETGEPQLREDRRYLRLDGTVFDAEVVAAPILFEGRRAILVMVVDVTKRKQAEAALRETTNRLQAIWDHAPTIMYIKDTAGRHLAVNREFERLLRAPGARIVGKLDHELFPQEIADAFRANDLRVLTSRSPLQVEEVVRHADGVHTYVSIKFPVLDAAGEPFGICGISTDITARKQAEDALRQTQAHRQAILDSALDAVVGMDEAGCVTHWNTRAEIIFGWPAQEAIGRDLAEIILPMKQREAHRQGLRQFLATGEGRLFNRRVEFTALRRDGSEFPVEVSIAPLKLETGYVFNAFIADITERKQAEEEKAHLEEQLRQAHKMEAIGRLAGGIAHDFNNLLTVITGYSEMLLQRLSRKDPLYGYAEDILKAGDRAAALTGQLLAFSRGQVVQPRVLDLNHEITKMVGMLQRLIGENIRLATDLAADLPPVRADAGQVGQVLMNLAVNARDAMPSGGTLKIETATVAGGTVDLPGQPKASGRPVLRLTVCDSGYGMDAATLAHVFEPFFTTKGMGKGTGLGLATVYGIVTQSGGTVEVASQPGQGTTVAIYLPSVDGSVGNEERSAESAQAAGGTETVLVVEDEASVRLFVRHVLAAKGYRVKEAATGEEALALCSAEAHPIPLLLTDLVMPGISGGELAERLRGKWPGTRVLFMSGYTEDADLRRGLRNAGVGFLPKPFTAESLVAAVRTALDVPSRAASLD